MIFHSSQPEPTKISALDNRVSVLPLGDTNMKPDAGEDDEGALVINTAESQQVGCDVIICNYIHSYYIYLYFITNIYLPLTT